MVLYSVPLKLKGFNLMKETNISYFLIVSVLRSKLFNGLEGLLKLRGAFQMKLLTNLEHRVQL